MRTILWKIRGIRNFYWAVAIPRKNDGNPDWVGFLQKVKKENERDFSLMSESEEVCQMCENFIEKETNPKLENFLDQFPTKFASSLLDFNQWVREYMETLELGDTAAGLRNHIGRKKLKKFFCSRELKRRFVFNEQVSITLCSAFDLSEVENIF